MRVFTLRRSGILLAAAAAALTACKGREHYGSRSDTTAATSTGAVTAGAGDTSAARANAGANAGARAGGGMTDANIAAVLDAANESDSAFGALAVRKGRSTDVKNFGRLMMGEHHALRLQGQQLVKRLNVTPQPPANFDLPNKQRDAMNDLQGKSGADFDKAYIDHEVDYHKQVLQTAQQALDQAQNAELKDLIRRAAPVIQKHLDRAEQIQKKLGGATS
jgi:putative membrane protein